MTKLKLFYFLPVFLCFCLPFGTLLVSGIVAAWFLVSFLVIKRDAVAAGIRNVNFWLMWGFFILTCISAALSRNGQEALSAVEVKLSFLVLPWLIFCFSWPPAIIKRCIVSFVSGCFFACLYLIIRATLYAYNGSPEHFFYTDFSDLLHASYFSMYLLTAIAFVMVFYGTWFKTQRTIIYSSWFFISIFIATIFLCSSKMGIITFFICMPLVVYYRWRPVMNSRIVIVLAVMLIAMLPLLRSVFPGAFERFGSVTVLSQEYIDKSATESSAVRVLIWREGAGLVCDHFWLGTGVGDANDALYGRYVANGLTGAYSHRLNAHNQFLQTFIGMGITGFIALLAITLWQAVRAAIRRNFLMFLFSLIIVLNFLVESMLQTAAGVLYFSLFYCILSIYGEKDLVLRDARDEDIAV